MADRVARAPLSKRKAPLKSNGGVPVPNLLTAEEHAQLAKDQAAWEEKNRDTLAKQALAARIQKELDGAMS